MTNPLTGLLASGMAEAQAHGETLERLDAALSLLRRMAERFDGASNGKCTVCGAGRGPGVWDFRELPLIRDTPYPCPNRSCLSHDIRSILLNAER